MSPDQTGKPFRVTSLFRTVTPGPGNELVRVVRVSYTSIDPPYKGEVDIPEVDADEATVRAAIEADLRRVGAIFRL